MGSGLPLSVLFVVPYAPTRIRTRPFHLVRALVAGGHRVVVATVWSNENERAALEELASEGVTVVAEELSIGRSLWNCLRALPGRDPLQAHYSWCPKLAGRLPSLVQEAPIDVVHVEHLRGVRYGLALAEAASPRGHAKSALVWDSVDCISSLFRRAAGESQARKVRMAARLELPRTERFEGAVAAKFDRVVVTSAVDRCELLELTDARTRDLVSSKVHVVPNGVDLGYFRPPASPREPMTIVITGKMSYHANATAVVRFVHDVMPGIWSELPDVRLWIVGKDPPREVTNLGQPYAQASSNANASDLRARVLVTGTVPDIRPFLCRATLAVAPIQYGVGVQNKVLEALACGTPVVATTQAVSALDVTSDKELLVATEPRDLASSIVGLLRDGERRERIGRAGRSFVEHQHNWTTLAARLASIYRDAKN